MITRALDTNILIFILTNHPEYCEAAASLFRLPNPLRYSASELVITELLSHSSVKNDRDEASVKDFLRVQDLRLVPVTTPILTEAARVRRQHGLCLADAIHVSSALISGADGFITNDRALLKLKINGLKFLSVADANV